MFRIVWVLIFFLLGGISRVSSWAQEGAYPHRDQERESEDTLIQAVEARVQAYRTFVTPHYTSPALLSGQYETSLSQVSLSWDTWHHENLVPKDQGTHFSPFSVQSASLIHLSSSTSIWGRASYTYAHREGVEGRESAHFDLTAPYVSVDTIGGNFDSECYAFSGGYSHRLVSGWRWGVEGAYEAFQERRARDPRVLNNVGDLHLKTALGYSLPTRVVALSLGARIYKQVHQMDFLNPKGAQYVFNHYGFDEYSLRFGGNTEAKAFNAYGWDIRGDLQPRSSNGFFATLDYRHLSVEYTLKSRNELRLSLLSKHRASLSLSYRSTHLSSFSWAIANHLEVEAKRGDEYLYGMQDGLTYPLLAVQEANYGQWFVSEALQGLLSLERPYGRWEILPTMALDFVRSERRQSLAKEQFTLLRPQISVRYHQFLRNHPRLVLRAEVSLEQRIPLEDLLRFGTLPMSDFHRPFLEKFRALSVRNHKLQTVPQTYIAPSLRIEYAFPKSKMVLYAQSRVAICYQQYHLQRQLIHAMVGLLF